jgi:hypothetical protein
MPRPSRKTDRTRCTAISPASKDSSRLAEGADFSAIYARDKKQASAPCLMPGKAIKRNGARVVCKTNSEADLRECIKYETLLEI